MAERGRGETSKQAACFRLINYRRPQYGGAASAELNRAQTPAGVFLARSSNACRGLWKIV
jgi:hypothetical protein